MTDFVEFWENYPRKDNKKGAETTFNRLNKKNQALAAQDCKDRYKDVAREFIPLPTSYINGEFWNNYREDKKADKVARDVCICTEQGCSNETHGPNYQKCIDHMPAPDGPVIQKMRDYYKSELIIKEGETKSDHTDRLRKLAKSQINGLIRMPENMK